ncbi:MAG: ferrous iron transporter B, partial [Oscillospiraceae bacterium]|nr:ferrous iron transporter B [Oscillospiraceae bacterium]
VPAVMATRTLPSERDKKMTILLTPFMSCSAKLPIYTLFTAAFFERYQALIMMSLYLLGIALGVSSAFIMNKTLFKGAPVPFVMELPNYRFPSPKTVLLLLREKAKDFITRAFTVIFLTTVVIWFLQTFDLRFNPVLHSSDSILAAVGQLLSVVFIPLGFSDWRVSTALITGFTTKEAVISTLAVLTSSTVSELAGSLHTLFTPQAAFSFLIFSLLYTPCVAAVAAIKREFKSLKWSIFTVIYQSGVAWLIAFIIYRILDLVG